MKTLFSININCTETTSNQIIEVVEDFTSNFSTEENNFDVDITIFFEDFDEMLELKNLLDINGINL